MTTKEIKAVDVKIQDWILLKSNEASTVCKKKYLDRVFVEENNFVVFLTNGDIKVCDENSFFKKIINF